MIHPGKMPEHQGRKNITLFHIQRTYLQRKRSSDLHLIPHLQHQKQEGIGQTHGD